MSDHSAADAVPQIDPVRGGATAEQSRALVQQAEERAPHGELVDERERQRLDRLAEAPEGADSSVVDLSWTPWLATEDGHPTGYVALLLDDDGTGASAELVVAPHHRRKGIGHALLNRLEATAREQGVDRLSIWSRDADESNARFARARGYTRGRTLLILERGDEPVPQPSPPDGVTIRAHRPGPDDAEIIRVLNAAFPDADRGWTRERLDEHRAFDWFDPAGLLVAEADDDGTLLGVHWTKRRGDGVGEVHILGLAPEGQGQGLGRALLRAGLVHLRKAGDRNVVLWMDAENTAARRLYESEGFTERYRDVTYARDL